MQLAILRFHRLPQQTLLTLWVKQTAGALRRFDAQASRFIIFRTR